MSRKGKELFAELEALMEFEGIRSPLTDAESSRLKPGTELDDRVASPNGTGCSGWD
jgi:hypothetical protein